MPTLTKTNETIFERVSRIIKNNFSDLEEIELETKLEDDLGLDSLDVIELTMECEKEFDLPDISLHIENIVTVQDLIKIITEKIG